MVLCIVIHVMPEYALDWVPGSGICLYQETLYRSVSCRRSLRRTAPCETPGMATQVHLAFHRRYWCSSIACRSTGQQSSAPSPPSQSEYTEMLIAQQPKAIESRNWYQMIALAIFYNYVIWYINKLTSLFLKFLTQTDLYSYRKELEA